MSDFADLFQSEAAEYLQILNDQLLELERTGGAGDVSAQLDEMFRAAHTLKGMSATMGYTALTQLTHRLEDLLDALRQGLLQFDSIVADLLFEGLDALEVILRQPAEGEVDPGLIERLNAMIAQAEQGERAPQVSEAPGGETGQELEQATAAESEVAASRSAPLPPDEEPAWTFTVHIASDAPMKSVRAYAIVREFARLGEVIACRPDPEVDDDSAFDAGMKVAVVSAVPPEEIAHRVQDLPDVTGVAWETAEGEGLTLLPEAVAASSGKVRGAQARTGAATVSGAAARTQGGDGSAPDAGRAGGTRPEEAGRTARPSRQPQGATGASGGDGSAGGGGRSGDRGGDRPSDRQGPSADRVVRVDTEQLDLLMNLVGELVIYKTRLEEVSSRIDHRGTGLVETVEHIDRITDSLQAVVMRLRMVPVSQVFNRFPRVVRDISRRMNKQVQLVMEGEETELDRSIVYRIGDPLVHLIRNAVDHGIEPAEERTARGKPPVGILKLAARHEGNQVVIEVSDDGRGIDLEKVRKVAIERGLVTPAEWEAMSLAERHRMIFRPGFTTAGQVTDVSGRGVGMDAVQSVVESLNGQVEVHSEAGRGTSVILRLPLTLAIIPALLVSCQSDTYALPLEYVIQNLRLRRDEIYTIQGYPHIRWRDEVLPLHSLAKLLHLPGASEHGELYGEGTREAAAADESGEQAAEAKTRRWPAVVVDVGPRRAALLVDEIVGQQEIVIKSIGFLAGKVPGVAGATVLGSGRAALIADLPALV